MFSYLWKLLSRDWTSIPMSYGAIEGEVHYYYFYIFQIVTIIIIVIIELFLYLQLRLIESRVY